MNEEWKEFVRTTIHWDRLTLKEIFEAGFEAGFEVGKDIGYEEGLEDGRE
jgi:flagellar biosynthesis/type III secretory pathway protein FliH